MNIRPRSLCKTLKKIFRQLGLEIADVLCDNAGLAYAVRPTTQIHCRRRERFIHGHKEVACAQDPALCPERFKHRLAQSNPGVLDGVMLIHIQVALGPECQIERAMSRDKVQHVVQKADSSGHAGNAAAIQIQPDADVCFVGFSVKSRGSWHRFYR
jgi:hypothetical protein